MSLPSKSTNFKRKKNKVVVVSKEISRRNYRYSLGHYHMRRRKRYAAVFAATLIFAVFVGAMVFQIRRLSVGQPVEVKMPPSNLSEKALKIKRVANAMPLPAVSRYHNMPLSFDLPLAREATALHIIVAGETWASLADRFGLSQSVATRIYEELEKKEKENQEDNGFRSHLREGDLVKAEFGGEFGFRKISYELRPGTEVIIRPQGLTSLEVDVRVMPTETKEFVAHGRISKSLIATTSNLSVPTDVIDKFVDLFSDKVEFSKHIRNGDAFSFIFKDEVLPDGRRIGKAKIVAASLVARGKQLVRVAYEGSDKKVRYFDEEGISLGVYKNI